MLVYYHGSDQKSIYNICNKGANISKGGGELGQGFYIGSSMWRACSWAWRKANEGKKDYNVLVYEIDDINLKNLKIVRWGRRKTLEEYKKRKKERTTETWISGNDAIWAPIVGGNIRDVMQIKFESDAGQNFINQQKHTLLW